MMNRRFKFIFVMLSLLIPLAAHSFSGERIVTNSVDGFREGNLRVILQDACADAGPDTILFDDGLFFQNQVFIQVVEPLVIPKDCNGPITIKGTKRVEIILDGSNIADRDPNQPRGRTPGDACILHIYSNGNTINDLTFGSNQLGAAICVFGKNNVISNNHIGRTKTGGIMMNRYGVIVSDALADRLGNTDGSQNQILSNQIGPSALNGIWVYANGSQFIGNTVTNSAQTGFELYGDDHLISGNKVDTNGKNGFLLLGDNLRFFQNTATHSGANGIKIQTVHSQLDQNTINSNFGNGILFEGSDSQITQNDILVNGGCTNEVLLPSQEDDCYGGFGEGVGLYIQDGSHDLMIGGNSVAGDGNNIHFNANGGIFIAGDGATEKIKISHNLISRNYGSLVAIDLGDDDITFNDWEDTDEGPNHLINYTDYFQSFPLVNSPDGKERYWSWGIARSAEEVEVYKVHPEDYHRDLSHGGGDVYLGQYGTDRYKTFDIMPDDPYPLESGTQVTLLSIDNHGNTSEYSNNYPVGSDQDLDGIIDSLETGNGTPQSGGTKFNAADSDGDGLPDSVEDQNRNGICEPELNESCAFNRDTDDDGLSDFDETHGDGVYNEGVDTNPNNPDTDHDGLSDGREDVNKNGIWEGYLLESNPLSRDSDNDYIDDYRDTCPSVFNPGQERSYCTNS